MKTIKLSVRKGKKGKTFAKGDTIYFQGTVFKVIQEGEQIECDIVITPVSDD